MKEINGRKKLLDVDKKGFFSMLGLRLFPLILLICTSIVYSMETTIKVNKFDTELHICELYSIIYVKKALLNYEEVDETISYEDYTISIAYEDITAYITIFKDNVLCLESCLIWDDIENMVVDYTYL